VALAADALHKERVSRLRSIAATLGFLVCAVAVIGMWMLPPQHSPFGRLDLEDPVGLFTSARLSALADKPVECRRTIGRSKLMVEPVPDVRASGFCKLTNAVSLARSVHPYSQPTRLSCPLAAALYIWEREVLAPAAREHLGAEIAQIEIKGAYSCRRMYGRASEPPSLHATGNAIDISGFRLRDGRIVTVERSWKRPAAESAFLHKARNGACRIFRGVLSPDYTAAHRDHFHFEMGEYRFCR
jgi:hypothetical protein